MNNLGILLLILISQLMVIRGYLKVDESSNNNVGQVKTKIGDDIQESSSNNSSLIRMRRSDWGRMRSMNQRILLAERRVAIAHGRSVWQLGTLIGSYTPYYRSKFVDYGHWCGYGGSGIPINECDRCCMHHDHCYDLLNGCHTYFQHYEYVDVGGRPLCKDPKGSCNRRLCQCDVDLVNCFNSVPRCD